MASHHNTQTAANKTNKAKTSRPKASAKTSAKTSAEAGLSASNKVDDASDQTFPASDAPASWAGKDIAPQDRADAQKKPS
jgi:hypothetical protein